ncbi:MAG: acetyl-CoA carboxylase biotin carboxyl carrier protein [Clostridia bacterium]|nr:acetyl-CoA carboxylase biotin carboxyl carrier protein [Clostridia bacterium]
MDIKSVKALADIMKGNDIQVIEVTEGDFKIRMEKGSKSAIEAVTPNVPAVAPEKALSVPPVQGPTALTVVKEGTEIKSPMVGVFYAAPSPDAEPFVKVGSTVKKGDVLCIIEAMKLMNEITAEQDGTITEVCMKNGDVVEYSQVLFRIK